MPLSRRNAILASGTMVTGVSFAAFDVAATEATPPKPRYPVLKPEEMYFQQRQAHEAVAARRDGGMAGPYVPLTYVPSILGQQQMLGEHVRYHTGVPPKLREWAICLAARNVNSWYVFAAHAPLALQGGSAQDEPRWGPRGPGVARESVDAVAAQHRPTKLDDDERLVYDFCMEVHNTGGVSDETFGRAEKRFGKAGILDLIAVYSHYATISLVANVAQMTLMSTPQPFVVPAD